MPYQLPPPRTSANIRFGTNHYLRQRQSVENTELGTGHLPVDIVSQAPRTEQLPPVSQILPHSFTGNPHPARVFGTSIASNKPSYPVPQHEASVPPHVSPREDRSGSLQQSQTGPLPPLPQVSIQSPRGLKHHAATRSDPTALSFPKQSLQHDVVFHEKARSTDLSSPASTHRSTLSSARPHVVDEQYIEGEGLCYVYADGSHCPKSVDGVPVNANWGITKAGKPRKRLARACITCREKKIKCRPNLFSRCDQCQKSGRDCRFTPRERRAPFSESCGKYDTRDRFSSSDHTAQEDSPSLCNIVRASDSTPSLPGMGGYSPISEGSMPMSSAADNKYEATVDTDRAYKFQTQPTQRLFSRVDDTPAPASSSGPVGGYRLPEFSYILRELRDVDPNDPLVASWNSDPYESDPEMATQFVECYFSHVNNSLFPMFPHTPFILWLRSCHTKSAEDKMLLYSMMTLGSVFSNRSDKVMASRRYSRIARFAIHWSQHRLSLQLAQSHLIMSLWYYAIGSLVGSWSSIGAAGRVICGLRYNMEPGDVVVDRNQGCDYGLHPHALIECRRRTFWVAFVLDRFSIYCSTSTASISSGSALLRLPCREEAYDTQQYADTPFFQPLLDHSLVSSQKGRSNLSDMAFLIEIMDLWGDAALHVSRSIQVPREAQARLAEDFHTSILQQTSDWITRLPEHLVFSIANLERSIRSKKADTFISIHMFYHATLMKISRHTHHQTLQAEVHRARYHAMEILRIVLAFDQYARGIESARSRTDPSSPGTTLLNPFLGYVILSAVDVLSAAGPVAELPDCLSMIRAALESLKELGRYWDSSLQLVAVLQGRVKCMVDCVNGRARLQEKMGFALDGPLLETKVHAGTFAFPQRTLNEDLFFAGTVSRVALLNATGSGDYRFSADNILWIRDC